MNHSPRKKRYGQFFKYNIKIGLTKKIPPKKKVERKKGKRKG